MEFFLYWEVPILVTSPPNVIWEDDIKNRVGYPINSLIKILSVSNLSLEKATFCGLTLLDIEVWVEIGYNFR